MEDYLPIIPKLPLILVVILFAVWALQQTSARKKRRRMPDWMKKKIAAGTLSMPVPQLLTTPRLILALILLACWAVMEKHFTPAWLGLEEPAAATAATSAPILLSERPNPARKTASSTAAAKQPAPAPSPTAGTAAKQPDTPASPQTPPPPAKHTEPGQPPPTPRNSADTGSADDTFAEGAEEEIITSSTAATQPEETKQQEIVRQPIYPTPQDCRLQEQYTRVRKITTEIRSRKSKGSNWDKLPPKEGAYAITITPGTLKAIANDETGLYYAKQTLTQLLRNVPHAQLAQRDPFPDKSLKEVAQMGELPLGEIIDWPDLPFRGTVEGYYGAPWSAEARKSQFEFYGRNKMNIYIYAPKDDKYHHGGSCYVPYPADEARKLGELVKYAHKNHVRFVWAIHPANTINWNQDGGKTDMDRLCKKLEQMYDIGVRDFGVFVDDAFGEIGKASRQVTLCNYLLEHFIRKHKDVSQQLIMCPTGYNRAWANVDYLRELGQGLDKSIHIMWTGDSVVHDITLGGQQWVNEQVGRPTFIWWNWPVNDYRRNRLPMGRTYGLGQQDEMKTAMSGFVSNPMEQSEASKVALFGVADYCWNIKGFDSVPSWKEGIRRLYPESHDAVQAFCDHNSSLTPSTHGYYREESVDLAETAGRFRDSLAKGAPDASGVERMAREFQRIEQAGKVLMTGKDLKEVREDAAPWFQKFRLAGSAGTNALRALSETDTVRSLDALLPAARSLIEMRGITRRNWSMQGVNNVPDVQVGSQVIEPSLNAIFDYVNYKLYAAVSGSPIQTVRPDFICNGGDPNRAPQRLRDGDVKTFWSSETKQQEGQWYGFDFKEPTVIHSISLITGGEKGTDVLAEAQLEYSPDGEQWKPVDEPVSGSSITKDFGNEPLTARSIRFLLTQSSDVRLAINEFSVNAPAAAMPRTNIAQLAGLAVSQDSTSIRIDRIMESMTWKPNQFIELILASPVEATRIEVNLENSDIKDWATIQAIQTDRKTVRLRTELRDGTKLCCEGSLLPRKPIKAIRITNTGRTPREFHLNTIRIDTTPQDPNRSAEALTDGSLKTAYSCDEAVNTKIRVPEGAQYVVVVGDAQCTFPGLGKPARKGFLRYCKLPGKGGSITLRAPKQPGKWIHEIIFRKSKPEF